MALPLPHSQVELNPRRPPTERELREHAQRVQENFEALAETYPLQAANIADGIAGAPVSALPTTGLYRGRQVFFYGDKSKGVIWHLLYDGEGTYPWKKMGGPPLRAGPNNVENATNTVTSGTGAPGITVPLKMEFGGTFGAKWLQTRATTQPTMLLRLAVNGVIQLETAAIGSNQFETFPTLATINPTQTLEKGQLAQMGYAVSSANPASFIGMTLEIDPIRVG